MNFKVTKKKLIIALIIGIFVGIYIGQVATMDLCDYAIDNPRPKPCSGISDYTIAALIFGGGTFVLIYIIISLSQKATAKSKPSKK